MPVKALGALNALPRTHVPEIPTRVSGIVAMPRQCVGLYHQHVLLMAAHSIAHLGARLGVV